jgi:hypothetical protein
MIFYIGTYKLNTSNLSINDTSFIFDCFNLYALHFNYFYVA